MEKEDVKQVLKRIRYIALGEIIAIIVISSLMYLFR